jgi:hypothetical protein
LLRRAHEIIKRYRHETPVGNQPHMICLPAENLIEAIDK